MKTFGLVAFAMLSVLGAQVTSAQQVHWTIQICRHQTSADRIELGAGEKSEPWQIFTNWERTKPADTIIIPANLIPGVDLQQSHHIFIHIRNFIGHAEGCVKHNGAAKKRIDKNDSGIWTWEGDANARDDCHC